MGEMGMIGIMLAMEVIEVSCKTIAKAAMTYGMSNFVFFVYFRVLAFLFLLPTCFLLYSSPSFHLLFHYPSPLTSRFSQRSYLCMLLMFTGLNYRSPTLASAIVNLNPAFTFILAIFFRMETFNLREKSSLFKFAGTIVLLTGAFTIIFYRGLPITFSPSPPDSKHQLQRHSIGANWAIGGGFLLCSCLALSIAFIVKTWVSSDYPFELMATMISCFFETVFAVLVAVFEEKDSSAWRLRLDIVLIAIVSSAIVMVGVINPVHLWVCRKKGPVFLAMFKPLQMIFAVILGVATLGDTLHLGSVLGGATIAFGFYTVMRGKAMEDSSLVDGSGVSCSDDSSPEQAPLLQPKSVNV